MSKQIVPAKDSDPTACCVRCKELTIEMEATICMLTCNTPFVKKAVKYLKKATGNWENKGEDTCVH